MMIKQPIDFTKVEALRKEMLLRMTDMAELSAVSRMTYHSWAKGKHIRRSNDGFVRSMLKKLLAVYTGQGWPSAEVRAMDSKSRAQHLKKLIAELD